MCDFTCVAVAHDGIPANFMPNIVTEKQGYHISYNWYDRRAYGSDTTALVLGGGAKFYVLNGDHRAALQGLPDWDACLAYFVANKALWNKYSDK